MGGVLVHDWIEPSGGAEKVLDAFADTFPEADIHCLWSDDPLRYKDRAVRQSWIARTPLRRHKAAALPLMPLAWRNMRAAVDPEWILVSSHLFAHHANFRNVSGDVPKLVYTHTPARYIWTPELDSRGASGVARLSSALLKPLDKRRSGEATSIVANSEFVRARIESTWGQEAGVIYPPVDVERIHSSVTSPPSFDAADQEVLQRVPANFILGASRLVPYKRLDTVIQVGAVLDTPVVIAGNGPDRDRLVAIAEQSQVPVIFLGRVSDTVLYELFARALLFVFPPVEDFGITPVEAMAAGGRVVANRLGGTAESLEDGISGGLTDFSGPTDIEAAANRALSVDPLQARKRAQKFSQKTFSENITAWVKDSL